MRVPQTPTANDATTSNEKSKSLNTADMDPTYLAKPSGACCIEGSIHKGNPRGSYIQVAGVETYIVKPSPENSNGNILLYYPDVWGMFTNGLLIMDGFADAGYLTIGLDYFRGVSVVPTLIVAETTNVTANLGPCVEAPPAPFGHYFRSWLRL
jgi:hypothetical protein